MDREDIEEAIEVLEDASAEMLTETGNENYYGEAITILRQALKTEQKTAVSPGKGTGFNYFRASAITVLRQPQEPVGRYEPEPEALRLADALDAEFVQGRISNSTGRESAVELRRLALKQWVGLTDDAVFEIADTNLYEGGKNFGVLDFARAVEQALKERNHG